MCIRVTLSQFLFSEDVSIYIYIVIHRQICFVLSELISVARQYLPIAGIETRLTQTSNLYIYIYIYIERERERKRERVERDRETERRRV